MSTLTAQSAFLNNFGNVVNRRVDIREDIKRYQETLSYAFSKVDYSIGENIYMIPSNMNLKIKTGAVEYNNKILVSNEKLILGKNEKVNLTVPAMKSHKTNSLGLTHAPAISQKNQEPTLEKINVFHSILKCGLTVEILWITCGKICSTILSISTVFPTCGNS